MSVSRKLKSPVQRSSRQIDVTVTNHGSLYLFCALTQAAKVWINENVEIPSHAHWGGGFVVEHRYAQDLMVGMVQAGLEVK